MNKEKIHSLENAVKTGLEYCQKESDELAMQYIQGQVVPRLKTALEDVIDDIQRDHRLDDKAESFVIHYTSIATLLCMLESSSKDKTCSSLRLYDSMHLNDPDEGNYFDRNLNLPKKHKWLLDRKRRSHAYIASFILPDTQKDMSDNLVFWRAYGHEGEGCSLLLDIPLCRLRKVLYGSDKVKRAERKIRPVLDIVMPLAAGSRGLCTEKIRENLAEIVWRSLEEIRYLYKSTAYDYERECRFVIPESSIDINEIRFERNDQKETASIIRHYCEDESLEICKLLVTNSSITLGPRVSDANNIRYYLETLLKRQELFGAEIKISKISYRKF